MPGEVRRVGESERHSGEVGSWRRSGGRDVDGLRKLGRDALRGVLVLESVAEDERVALCSVLAKIILEFRRGFCLDVADLRAEAVADSHESLIRAGIPRLVGDRPRGQQRDLELGAMRRGALAVVSAGNQTSRARAMLKTVENRHIESTPIALVHVV